VVEALLGKGGFGTVYRASHPVIGKLVAIKVLARKYASDPAVISRFAAEARAVNQIRHRNIIDIFQFSQLADGRHYYVMECLDGEPLDRYLAQHGPLPLAEALPILKAIGRALDAAHAKGIAHRDLKPENIFLARDPSAESGGEQFPKLLDFGIAKLFGTEVTSDARFRTATGIPIGTPYYMSPEQCRGKDVDHRTDIYSFGIVAFRMLTGTYPFDGDDYVELLFKQVNDEPPLATTRNPALPAYVADAIAWMMRKDPASRPANLAEATAALGGGASSASSLPRTVTAEAFARTIGPAPPPTLLPAKSGRKPAVWIGGALVLVCSAAGAMLVVNHASAPGPTAGDGAPPAKTERPLVEPMLDHHPATPPPAEIVNAVKPRPPITLHVTGAPAHATATLGTVTIDLPGDLVVAPLADAAKLVIDAPGYKQRVITIHPDKNQDVKVPAMEHVRRAHETAPPEDHMDIAHPTFPGGH
jgi:serine/threonine-protein kinase